MLIGQCTTQPGERTSPSCILLGGPTGEGSRLGADERSAAPGHPAPGGPLGIMQNLIRLAPSADFQARWNWDQTYETRGEAERALRRHNRLRRFQLQAAAVAAVGSKRLRECLRVRVAEAVGLVYSPSADSSHYRGLSTCASVWACPVCAAKISERRRVELGQAIKTWREKMGGVVWLVTLTFSHQRQDSIFKMNRALSAAMRRFQGGEAAKKDRERFDIWGQVRALEVTHGQNGWHPHVHQLVFLEGEDTPERREELRERLFKRWHRACELSGLGLPNERHGVRVDGHDQAGEYITKWGLESELTKHVVKDGRGSSRTPMGILADFLEGGDLEDAALFSTYASAMKGSRQLVWSRGLRDLLGLGEEQTDEELAAADEQQLEDLELEPIASDLWRLVVKYDVRGQLLALTSRTQGDQEAVSGFLEMLRDLERR